MALPTFHRKLFQSDGYGPLLKPEIIPFASDLASDSANAVASTEWVNDWFVSKRGKNVLYVDPVNGDDSNDGLSAATAKKTIAAAKNSIRPSSYLWPSLAAIHLAAGNYSEELDSGYGVVFQYIGPSSGTANISGAIYCSNGSIIFVGGNISVTNPVQAYRNGLINFNDGAHIYFSNYGSHTSAIYLYSGGSLSVPNNTTVTFSFTGSVGTATNGAVVVTNNSTMSVYGTVEWTGRINGKRYVVSHSSVLAGMGSTTAIPGSEAGTVDSTSYYS